MSTIASSAPRRALRSLVPPLKHLVLLAIGLMMVAPFIWMVLTSFKPLSQLLTDPLSALPDPWIFTNWPDAWNALPFGRAYLNSFYITVLVVAGTLLTTSMAAYGFSRLPFKGSKVIFGIFLAMQMVPKQVTLVPFYFLMAKIGWVDSHLALIVPAILVNPFGVFLMRQFIASIPRELEEAALLDGASKVRVFFTLILPMAKAPISTLAILTYIAAWNDYFWPLLVSYTDSSRVLTVALAVFKSQSPQTGPDWAGLMAATLVAALPMLLLFAAFAKRIVNSIGFNGIK